MCSDNMQTGRVGLVQRQNNNKKEGFGNTGNLEPHPTRGYDGHPKLWRETVKGSRRSLNAPPPVHRGRRKIMGLRWWGEMDAGKVGTWNWHTAQ